MGDRANYVIVENGSWHLHYSHWGAVGLDLDLLPGPAAATRFVRAQRTVTRWLDDVWCEGAALIDHDRRLLLWFSTHLDDYAYRAAALAVLARTWPGRRIEWAYDGLGDIVAYLGLERATIRSSIWPEPIYEGDPESGFATLLTVTEAGRTTAYALDSDPPDVVPHGAAAVLAALPRLPTITACPSTPESGIHLDVTTRTAGVWTIQPLQGVLDRVAERWPGWRWEFWRDRYGEQLTRSGVEMPGPDLRSGLTDLAIRLESHRGHDPVRHAESLVNLRRERAHVELSPHFFDHRTGTSLPEEDAKVFAAIQELTEAAR